MRGPWPQPDHDAAPPGRPAGDRRATIVCMKWGEAYQARHVNQLFHDVGRNLSLPHDFVLIGDTRAGIDQRIAFVDMADLGIPPARYARGAFPKVALYKRGLFPSGHAVLFLDLDVMVCGPLDRFVHRIHDRGGLHVTARRVSGLWPLLPRALRRDRGGDTTAIGFLADTTCDLYDAFIADPEGQMARFENDQDYVSGMARHLSYWPEAWIKLFRRDLLWPYPLNLVLRSARTPKNCIVNFGGYPKVHQLVGTNVLTFGRGRKKKIVKLPVRWVAERWRD